MTGGTVGDPGRGRRQFRRRLDRRHGLRLRRGRQLRAARQPGHAALAAPRHRRIGRACCAALVERHVAETSSRYAARAAARLGRALPQFWQVVPKEYVKYLPVPLRPRQDAAIARLSVRRLGVARGVGAITRPCACSTICRSRPSRARCAWCWPRSACRSSCGVEKVWERRPEYLELNPAGTVPTLVEENGLAVARFRRDLRVSGGGLSRHAADGPHARASGSRCAGWSPGSTASSPPR